MIETSPTQPMDIPRMPDYEVIRCIGAGAFGDVWLARAKATQRFRAVKLVCRSRFPRESLYETEFAGLKKFEEISREYPGFIDILHISRDDHNGCFCYVMELADDLQSGQFFDPGRYISKTLENEFVRRHDPAAKTTRWFTPAESVEVALSVTSALSALHENGLAHRDIKPSNIVFVRGVPKLADVGLITEFKAEESASTLIGTPQFMDPAVHGTAAGDLFAFGKMLYMMVTGRPLEEWPKVPPEAEQSEDPHTYRELLHISEKACDPDRTRRYKTAEEIHKQLLLLRVGHSLRRLQRLERFVGTVKRFAVVAAMIAVLLGLFIYQTVERRKQAAEIRQHQVGSFVAYGTRALDEGDLIGALPWFADALRQDRNNSRSEPLHRLRLGMLLRQCPTIIQMWFTDHPLNYAQFAGQENQVLLPAPDRRWAIHDLATGKALHKSFGLPDRSDTVSVSLAANLAVTSNFNPSNRVVQVWNCITGEELPALRGETAVSQAAISPDGRWVAAAVQTNKAMVWKLATGESVTLEGHTRPIMGLAFSPTAPRLVSTSGDKTAIVWDLETGKTLTQFTNHTSWIYGGAFSPDGRLVATAGFDNCGRVWEVDTGREVLAPLRHGDGVHSIEFSADGRFLVTAGLDFSVRVWSAATGELLQELRHNSKPLSAGFSPSGRYIVTACYDGAVRVWLLHPGKFAPQPAPVAYSADGLCLAFATNRAVQVAGVENGKRIATAAVGDAKVVRTFLNRDGSRLLMLAEPPPGSPSNSLQAILWDCTKKSRIGSPTILDERSTNLVFSPDGGLVCAVTNNHNILWDFSRDRAVLEFPGRVQAAAFDSSSRYLAVARTNDVEVWDFAGPEARLVTTCPHASWVGSVGWSLDGRHLVTGCWDTSFNPESAQVWESLTGRRVGPTFKHRDGVRESVFSPDGKTLVTCGEDSVAMLWEWKTGRQLAPPLRHNDHVVCASFSQDGRKLATGTRKGEVRVWTAVDGEPITQNLEHGLEITGLQWVHGGAGLAVQTVDGRTRLWRLLPDTRSVEKLVQISNLLSGQQIHSTGSAIPETKEALQQLWTRLRSDYPADFSD